MSEVIRINSYLSRCGVCSRRQADNYITEGRVKVNDTVITQLGTKIDIDKDIVEFDGNRISLPVKNSYYIINKPDQVVTTMHDPQNRKTIGSYINEIGIRLFPVGRLDYNSEGLIILTDDGELSHRIQHPRYKIVKTYIIDTEKPLGRKEVSKIGQGVMLEDGFAKVLSIKSSPNSTSGGRYCIKIAEGRKRMLRRLFERFGHKVLRLKRISNGNIYLEELPSGHWRELSIKEIKGLKKLVKLE